MEHRQPLLRQSGELIAKFAELIGHRYERQRAERILYESHLNESNKASKDWMDTVQSCAEALEFRIRRLQSTVGEVVELAASGVPVAFLAGNGRTSNSPGNAPDSERTWFLITGARRGRLNVLSLESAKSKWHTPAEVSRMIGLTQSDQPAYWLVCYPVLMHDASSAHLIPEGGSGPDHHHSSLSPLRRLQGILKAELADIFVIVIFSVVIGLLTLTTPIAVEALVNTLAFGQFTQPVLVLSLIVLILLSFSSVLTAICTYTSEIIQRRLFVRMVEDLAYRLPRVERQVQIAVRCRNWSTDF